jgi:hypothetical protein
VVCPRCTRWNLTPLDDRLERIEAVARAAHQGRVVAATSQVALIRWQRYDFIRVGSPPRVELATWRYGERLRTRARERARVVVPLTLAALGLGIAVNVAAGGSLGIFVWNLHGLADAAYLGFVGRRRIRLVEPPACPRCGHLIQLRAKDVQHARLLRQTGPDAALLVHCPRCLGEAGLLTGAEAARALRQGLTYLNASRRGRRGAGDAARLVDRSGGAEGLVRDVAAAAAPLRSLAPERRLALEMALDEQAELAEIERQWHDAEEIAAIADGLLSTTPEIEAQLRRIHRKIESQPDG